MKSDPPGNHSFSETITMQFKNGYLGAFLVVIAVVMTIAGSYVMSLDMEEKTVTK